ncbi:kinase-like domain-containing protein, partial [Coemansia mojavensis]
IKQEQVFPKYSSELKIFDPLSCNGLIYFKMLPMYDVGFSSGYKTTFMDEIYTYEKLDKLHIRGIPKYYGCIISNGFIKGFAIDGYILNLEEYVSKNIISQDISDKINSELSNIVKDLHSHNIVHGDLNPRNIMLDKNNNVFIIDFDSSGDNMLKKGSTGWMRDDYCKDKSDDLYSLQLVQEFMNQQ